MITLREIDRNNFIKVIKLSVNDEQKNFVASNMLSLAQAKAQPECIPQAIYNDEEIVGFIMYCLDEEEKEYWIYRLMVDKEYQGRGFAREAMKQLLVLITQDKEHNRIYISFEPENKDAKRLYKQLGFIEDGRISGDEIVYRFDY